MERKRTSPTLNCDSDDESIWELKPRITRSKSTVSKKTKGKAKAEGVSDRKVIPKVTKSAKGGKSTKKTKQGKHNGKESTEVKSTPSKNIEGHCPFCQMPFSCLVLESPRCHTSQCMDLPLLTSEGQ